MELNNKSKRKRRKQQQPPHSEYDIDVARVIVCDACYTASKRHIIVLRLFFFYIIIFIPFHSNTIHLNFAHLSFSLLLYSVHCWMYFFFSSSLHLAKQTQFTVIRPWIYWPETIHFLCLVVAVLLRVAFFLSFFFSFLQFLRLYTNWTITKNLLHSCCYIHYSTF